MMKLNIILISTMLSVGLSASADNDGVWTGKTTVLAQDFRDAIIPREFKSLVRFYNYHAKGSLGYREEILCNQRCVYLFGDHQHTHLFGLPKLCGPSKQSGKQ